MGFVTIGKEWGGRRGRGSAGTKAATKATAEATGRPGEAPPIAPACGEPPEGGVGWTLNLLADRLVEGGIVESIDTETVRQTSRLALHRS